MVEIVSSISTAIGIAKKLVEASEKARDANSKLLLADLTIKLAEIKMQLADVMEENTQLKSKVRALETAEGDPCPRCRKRGWHVESSRPDPLTGELGGIRRMSKCSFCGFSEEKLDVPR